MDSKFTQQFFEDSSKAWMANKVKYGQSMVAYKPNAFVPDIEEPTQRILTRSQKHRMDHEAARRARVEEPVALRLRRSPLRPTVEEPVALRLRRSPRRPTVEEPVAPRLRRSPRLAMNL